MRTSLTILSLLLLLPCMVLAQNWEVGGSAGYGFYRNINIPGHASAGKTGFGPGLAFGGVFGNSNNRRIAGEARYTYRAGDARISSGGAEATAGSESHALHYDFLVHSTTKEDSIRPFLAAGAGVKIFRGTGKEPAYQPLSDLVVLTHTTQAEPLISVGGGIKVPVSRHMQVRLDARDYLTPAPDKLLASPSASKTSGWMHDFVVMIGISRVF